MAGLYFDLFDDVYIPGRWHLDDPVNQQGQEIRTWQFVRGEPAHVDGRIRIPIYVPGRPLDFSLLAGATIPVVHARVAAVFAELAPGDVQLIPVDVDGQSEPYVLLNITRVVKCIDDEASDEVRHWEPGDDRPDKTGQYRSVIGMRIDPSKVGDARVFRTWGWSPAIIISEEVKQALERMGATGVKFKEVTGPSTISADERARNRKIRELLETAATARESAWRTLGSLDKEVFMPIAMSGSWPGHRQLWSVIRREAGRTLLVTHGLSDPFIERLEPSVGFGLELALEVDATVKDISKGWPLLLLNRVADEVAEHEHVRESVKAGLFSMEVSGKGIPKSLVTEEGRVAVLLGVESRTLPSHFSTPYGEVKLVTVKALLPSELAYLLEHGAEGQAELARRFVENGEEHLSRLRRKPVA
ncbi:MAG: imm11 family protein [Hyalangium sp.]|uniref:imm11 family protein n=1 Tax=Hyalangium sp. TaxID=2028555 RepID=UPI00389A9790